MGGLEGGNYITVNYSAGSANSKVASKKIYSFNNWRDYSCWIRKTRRRPRAHHSPMTWVSGLARLVFTRLGLNHTWPRAYHHWRSPWFSKGSLPEWRLGICGAVRRACYESNDPVSFNSCCGLAVKFYHLNRCHPGASQIICFLDQNEDSGIFEIHQKPRTGHIVSNLIEHLLYARHLAGLAHWILTPTLGNIYYLLSGTEVRRDKATCSGSYQLAQGRARI